MFLIMNKMQENLKNLMEMHGDDAYSLAEKSGVPQPTTHRFLSGKHGDPRSTTVKKWAAVYSVTESQLRGDEPLLNDSKSSPSLVVHSFQKSSDEFVTINQFDEVGASMGVGVLLAEQPGQITSWNVTKEWLAKNIPANTGSGNLSIITGFGDSMKGMFNPGDPIVIDTGIKACKHDGVFFFRVGDEGFVKRLQRIPGKGIKVISTNPEYESWTITPDMDFQVLGKVLKVWESTEF